MRTYLALINIDVRLALRDKLVIFFNYLFPLIFFFTFAELMGDGGAIAQVVTMVLAIGILGNGLWGAGMRLVQEREMNILRRFKVTPISPFPILTASLVTGWLIYMPAVLITCGLAIGLYGMPVPKRWLSLFVLVSLGVIAFRGIGLIIAAVVNSVQESTIAIQLFYMPMLFLSGATIPVTILPDWAQAFAQFLPASYLITGFQGVFLNDETLLENWQSAVAMVLTVLLAVWISAQLFRWEKGEKLSSKARLWLLAVLAPFLLLGGWQLYSHEHIEKTSRLWRDLQRRETVLIRDARLFIGDGRVIENGSVLVRNGRIDTVFEGPAPSASRLHAEVVEGAGKTLLPGLIDVHIHLGSPGGLAVSPADAGRAGMERELAAYLYSGVTTVRSVGDWTSEALALRRRVRDGLWLGADLYACGPMFTAEGGHGTEYLDLFPEGFRKTAREQLVRTPGTVEEAREQVRQLKTDGVDCIKAILETGSGGRLFERLDTAIFGAIAQEAHAQSMPLSVHTGGSRDISDAVAAGAASIEHGSFSDEISDQLLSAMAKKGIFYVPTLSVLEAAALPPDGVRRLLERPLLQQAAPARMLRGSLRVAAEQNRQPAQEAVRAFGQAKANLLRAWKAGVPLATGSDAGNPLVIHGPTIQRELALWVSAGIPPEAGLAAATSGAARLLRADKKAGRLQAGYDADLLLVDGNPLDDIAALERISLVMNRGERISRSRLFHQR